jgi:competence protein ComFC
MFIKKNKNPRVSAFLSSEIASVLRANEDISELLADDVIVTYVPRSRSAVIKYGHDQSELLALCLAESLGTISLPLLCRSRKRGVAQKKLDAKAREKNSKNMYELVEKHRPFIEGKTVILVDDIVTTGSSMSACVSRLIKAGARFVICASVATTEVSKGH